MGWKVQRIRNNGPYRNCGIRHSWTNCAYCTGHRSRKELSQHGEIQSETNDERLSSKVRSPIMSLIIRFFIIDEVSMLDNETLTLVNGRLNLLVTSKEKFFSGVSIIFFGDFLQLPAVRIGGDVYQTRSEMAFTLWQSLNSVVILTEQMWQVEDPMYAELLKCVRCRQPTREDIATLQL